MDDIGMAMVKLRVVRSEEADMEKIMALRKVLLEKRPPAKPRVSWIWGRFAGWRKYVR